MKRFLCIFKIRIQKTFPLKSLLVALLLYCSISFSESAFTGDSLIIVQHCQTMLKMPNKTDSIRLKLMEYRPQSETKKWDDIYYYNYAKVLFQLGKPNEAGIVSKKGLDLFVNDSLAKNASKHHNIIAAVLSFENKYPQAIAEYTKAVRILEYHDDRINAALVKSNIGNLFFSLSDYESAYKNCKAAMQELKENNDTLNLPGITAVVAVSAVRLGKIEEGKALTKKSMELSERYNNPIGLIVSYLSEGEYQDYVGNYQASKTAYLTSLKYAEMYRQQHYILLDKIGLLKAEVNLKNYEAALAYGLEAMAKGDQLSNGNTRYAILKNLSYAYHGLEKYKMAFPLLDSAHQLYISTANSENKANINEILIQYDTEKKERKLIENELKIASQKIKINERNNWIIGLSLLALVAVTFYLTYKRKKKQELQAIRQNAETNALEAAVEGEEKERERLANELHDGIASSLTAIRLKLEQNMDIQKGNEVIDQLRSLHEDTRRISHNLMPISLYDISLEEALENYSQENSTEQTQVHVQRINKKELDLLPAQKNSLYRICQELLQNALKHANAKQCNIQINQNDTTFHISIEDDGCGFNTENVGRSQGLTSIKKRLASMAGELMIESKINEGTLVIITIDKVP